ncbi:hypothetical protein KY290_004941 [Solanum tuberosum]|uniref:Non-LTR retroelement reverse transcriptase n=1 Tax=Solanum tuberosum TaxID=4113 RepID=A0ABQ7WEH1_SOLTU|nr:hypothetical protein KY290_004941 [Solanum tuberosum]
MGSPVSPSEVHGFQGMLDTLKLTPLRSIGWHFTWCNKQEVGRKVYSKIDWALGDLNWLQQYGQVKADYLNPSISDHSPILIKCCTYATLHPKPFRFYPNIMEQPDFKSILRQVWEEKMLLLEVEKWSRVEEQVLRQKSRATWIKCGDVNSKYFHAQWKIRCSQNAITAVYTDNNTKLTDPRAIEDEFIGVFTGLMGSSNSNLPCLNAEVVKTGVCLTLQQQKDLIKEVTKEEIIEAIKTMPKEKAPGADGFPIEFFTGNWDIVNGEVLEVVQQFFITGDLMLAINTTAITLIPKVPSPTKVKDYRPIACCTSSYKIISKVLT